MKIGIIGAGIAGLATAVRLAKKGHEVHVFEANSYAGGKLSDFEISGKITEGVYRFDAGPSLFTMPMYVEKLLGEDTPQYFSYQKLDTVCHYFWDDGTRLTAYSDKDKLAQEIENQLDIPKNTTLRALYSAKNKYENAGRIFLEKSLHKLQTWLTPQVAKSLFLMPTFDIFKSMNATHEQLVGKNNPKLIQFFNRFATYNGSNPYRASGMLSVIPHFEHGIGAFYPDGGMNSITNSIFNYGKNKGVHYYFNSKVEEIIIENKKAIGLKVKNTEGGILAYNFDRIVSNMDVYFTYKKLMPNEKHPERTLNQERSTSALIFYWGIRHIFKELDLHNIFFSNDYKNEFDHLAQKSVCDDPTVYVNISSKFTKTDAPDGCENWFVMVNVPSNSGKEDWEEIIKRTRENVLKKISHNLGIDIQSLIECEAILDPLSIESRTASFGGALYGTSSNAMLSAFMRHPNFSSKIKHLYFVGGSVHPGGGIPLALLSAKIVDDNFK